MDPNTAVNGAVEEITAMALVAWHVVTECLAERGEVWPNTTILSWGVGLQLAFARYGALVQALEVLGGPSDGQIWEMYDRRATVVRAA